MWLLKYKKYDIFCISILVKSNANSYLKGKKYGI